MSRNDTVSGWRALAVGDQLMVVKLAPDGSEAARYAGEVIANVDGGGWVAVQATWAHQRVEVDGLSFVPGDRLVEWFSPEHDFNAFAVHAPGGELKGWYANVTYPTRLDASASRPILTWHDLYIDLICLPDGTLVVRDEDELEESGLEQRDPRLHQRITLARDEIRRRLERGLFPFADGFMPAG